MTSETNTPTGADTGGAGELVLAPDALLGAAADRLVEQARADGVALTGEGGLLTGLVQRVLQGALEAEITDHLGYAPHAVEGRGSGNSRNGHYPKTVRTEVGFLTAHLSSESEAAAATIVRTLARALSPVRPGLSVR